MAGAFLRVDFIAGRFFGAFGLVALGVLRLVGAIASPRVTVQRTNEVNFAHARVHSCADWTAAIGT